MDLTLVVLAAGMGSRYGGLKQLDPIGPSNEVIIDYSIFDAVEAGFNKAVCIIRPEIEQAFHDEFGKNIEKVLDLQYVYQKGDENIPSSLKNVKRSKPWGTAHALLACKDVVKNPFVVINADDFYGKAAYKQLAEFLKEKTIDNKNEYAMVGFAIKNTITDHGYVSRGICEVDDNGYLSDIVERLRIEKDGEGAKFTEDDGATWTSLDPNTPVSMNMWGLTPHFFKEIEDYFPIFAENNKNNLEKAEFYIPTAIDHVIKNNAGSVKVLKSIDKWYGVTYKEDKAKVQEAISKMVDEGKYKRNLWE